MLKFQGINEIGRGRLLVNGRDKGRDAIEYTLCTNGIDSPVRWLKVKFKFPIVSPLYEWFCSLFEAIELPLPCFPRCISGP